MTDFRRYNYTKKCLLY